MFYRRLSFTDKVFSGPVKYFLESSKDPQGGRLKALVWFWWIDETLSANLVYQNNHEIGSTILSGGAMVKIMMMVWWPRWSSARFENEEREKQKAQGKGETWNELFGLVIETICECDHI
jgi:hypothetical protein